MRNLIALIALLPLLAAAQVSVPPIEIRWQAPAAFVSGAPLDPETDIGAYNLYCKRHGSDDWPDPYVMPGGTVTEHTAERADILGNPGWYECAMTAVTVDGLESEFSNVATLHWRGRPGPVIILSIE
jgi:hypothetical protein